MWSIGFLYILKLMPVALIYLFISSIIKYSSLLFRLEVYCFIISKIDHAKCKNSLRLNSLCFLRFATSVLFTVFYFFNGVHECFGIVNAHSSMPECVLKSCFYLT
jgi:hypothetical protein